MRLKKKSLVLACGLFAASFEAQGAPPSPPRVHAVYVDSSSWASAFKSNLAAIGVGSATLGYKIPTAYNSAMRNGVLPHQLKTSPWINIDTIHVAFSENVQITASDFAIKGVNGSNNEVVYSGTFTYNSTTHVATWTTGTAFERNKLLVIVSGEVRSVATGVKLAGGWTNPDPSVPRNGSVFPSGGSPGETFFFRANILPGDVTRDASLNSTDVRTFRGLDQNASVGDSGYTPLIDISGSGHLADTSESVSQLGVLGSLPSDEPTLTMPTAGETGGTAIACPAGYIPVPGNTTAGLGGSVYTQGTKSNYDWVGASETIRSTADFCVMKYEAKNGGSHKAVSVPEGTPWVWIQREYAGANNDAQEACENNGAGYQLIGNHHWQAIARNIESVPSNFDTSGPLTDHAFNRGHADNGPNSALAADADDANGCIGMTSIPDDDCGGVWHINKRTHSLSNGEVIWDLSGNVREWVRDNNSSSQGSNGYMKTSPYSDALKWGPANDYSSQTGSRRAGLGYGTLNYSAGAVFRGGSWGAGTNAGPFYAYMYYGPSYSTSVLGFRCVFAP